VVKNRLHSFNNKENNHIYILIVSFFSDIMDRMIVIFYILVEGWQSIKIYMYRNIVLKNVLDRYINKENNPNYIPIISIFSDIRDQMIVIFYILVYSWQSIKIYMYRNIVLKNGLHSYNSNENNRIYILIASFFGYKG